MKLENRLLDDSVELAQLIAFLGFILFYAPFALFQKIIFFAFTGKWQQLTIHSLCFRIQTEHLLDGKLLLMSLPFIACIVILLIVTLFFGPVFCGRLCPAGAFTEYLSKVIPSRLQISWRTYTEIVPFRYGMLAGFVILPFFDSLLACAYCNFFLFDLFVNYFVFGYFISLRFRILAPPLFLPATPPAYAREGLKRANIRIISQTAKLSPDF